jgi:hypothetical protein
MARQAPQDVAWDHDMCVNQVRAFPVEEVNQRRHMPKVPEASRPEQRHRDKIGALLGERASPGRHDNYVVAEEQAILDDVEANLLPARHLARDHNMDDSSH